MHTQPTPVLIHGDEHSIGGQSATPSSTSLVFDSLTGSYVETDTMHIDVSGCTDMHGYGMLTILYPYDPNKSTNRGRRARDTVIVSICYCMSAYCRRCIRLQ